jgi:hypothetical protein
VLASRHVIQHIVYRWTGARRINHHIVCSRLQLAMPFSSALHPTHAGGSGADLGVRHGLGRGRAAAVVAARVQGAPQPGHGAAAGGLFRTSTRTTDVECLPSPPRMIIYLEDTSLLRSRFHRLFNDFQRLYCLDRVLVLNDLPTRCHPGGRMIFVVREPKAGRGHWEQALLRR